MPRSLLPRCQLRSCPGKILVAAKASLPNPHFADIKTAIDLRHKVRRLDRFSGFGLQWNAYYALVEAERKLGRRLAYPYECLSDELTQSVPGTFLREAEATSVPLDDRADKRPDNRSVKAELHIVSYKAD